MAEEFGDSHRRPRPAATPHAQLQPGSTQGLQPRDTQDGAPAAASGPDAAITADVNRVTAAALEGFKGPAWGEIVGHLYPYAVDTFIKWIRTGEVFKQLFVHKIPHRVKASSRALTWEQRSEFARDLVTHVLGRFRENVLKKGIWDPTRGTQLRTFFVHYCLFYFGDRYASLLKTLALEQPRDELSDEQMTAPGPEQVAVDRAHLHAVIATADPTPEEVVLLSVWLADDKLEVAAQELGLTYKTVEYRVKKLRDRFRGRLTA